MASDGQGQFGVEAAQAEFTIVNELGLHARAAAKLVTLASRCACDVELEKDGHVANAKSVMGVLLLCGAMGTSVVVRARGAGAVDAVRAIGDLIRNRFGEAQ